MNINNNPKRVRLLNAQTGNYDVIIQAWRHYSSITSLFEHDVIITYLVNTVPKKDVNDTQLDLQVLENQQFPPFRHTVVDVKTSKQGKANKSSNQFQFSRSIPATDWHWNQAKDETSILQTESCRLSTRKSSSGETRKWIDYEAI